MLDENDLSSVDNATKGIVLSAILASMMYIVVLAHFRVRLVQATRTPFFTSILAK